MFLIATVLFSLNRLFEKIACFVIKIFCLDLISNFRNSYESIDEDKMLENIFVLSPDSVEELYGVIKNLAEQLSKQEKV